MNARGPQDGPRAVSPSAQPPDRGSVLVTAGSLVLGAAYYLVLVAVPFPPDWVRLVPAVWLVGAATGVALSLTAMRAGAPQWSSIASLLLSLASLAVSAIFALAALMGD